MHGQSHSKVEKAAKKVQAMKYDKDYNKKMKHDADYKKKMKHDADYKKKMKHAGT